MWEKLKTLLKIMVLTFCLSLSLPWLSSAADMITTSEAGPRTTIVMSTEQWTTLKQELTEQTIELNQLRQKLKMLKSTSSEQMKLLENLQNELNATQKNLTNASVSLTECQNALKESRESLQTLKVQIKQMEHKQTVLRRQRDVWAAIAALFLGGVIARR